MAATNVSRYVFRFLLMGFVALGLAVGFTGSSPAGPRDGVIARGGGTTILEAGTGAPGFVPVLTTIAFNAHGTGSHVSGAFECLARGPESATGPRSAQFTVNAMYVTGRITGAVVNGDTATLTGTATVTGLGAGTNLPFTFVVRSGGPGATATLEISGLTFKEILLEGIFEVGE